MCDASGPVAKQKSLSDQPCHSGFFRAGSTGPRISQELLINFPNFQPLQESLCRPRLFWCRVHEPSVPVLFTSELAASLF